MASKCCSLELGRPYLPAMNVAASCIWSRFGAGFNGLGLFPWAAAMSVWCLIVGTGLLADWLTLRGGSLWRMHCIFGCPLSSSLRILCTKRAPLEDSKILRIRFTLQMSVPRFRAKGNFLRILCPGIDVWASSLLLKLHVLS